MSEGGEKERDGASPEEGGAAVPLIDLSDALRSGSPRTYRSRLVAQTFIVGGSILGLTVASVLWVVTPGDGLETPRLAMAAPFGGVLLFQAFIFAQVVRWRRAVRLAQRAGGRLCPCCLCGLEGVTPAKANEMFRCPECGAVLTTGELCSAWSLSRRGKQS